MFSKEIADVSARRGYKAHDVISLSNSTPNLDELLINFQKNTIILMMKFALLLVVMASLPLKEKMGHSLTLNLSQAISYLFLKMQDIILPCKMIVKL